MYCMSVLVNCCSLELIEKCLKGIKFLFNSPFWSKDVARAVTTLREMIGLLGCFEKSTQSHTDLELTLQQEMNYSSQNS